VHASVRDANGLILKPLLNCCVLLCWIADRPWISDLFCGVTPQRCELVNAPAVSSSSQGAATAAPIEFLGDIPCINFIPSFESAAEDVDKGSDSSSDDSGALGGRAGSALGPGDRPDP